MENHEILSDLLTKFNRFLQDSYEECCNSGIVCDDRMLSHQQLVTWIYYCLKDIKEFLQEIEKLFNDNPETLKEYIAHHRCSEDDERKLQFAYLKIQEAQKELQEYHEEEIPIYKSIHIWSYFLYAVMRWNNLIYPSKENLTVCQIKQGWLLFTYTPDANSEDGVFPKDKIFG